MSAWQLLLVPILLLVLARWILPRPRVRSEFRGILGLLWWLNAAYCVIWHRLELGGWAPLPEEGPAILISNHTCNIDHMLLQAGSARLLGFMIAKEYYEYPPFHPFCRRAGCIPVRRDGRDVSATRAALRALQEGRVLPIFPEGHIVPRSGRAFDEGKPGAAFIALRAGVPVIPAYIWGTPPTNDFWKSVLTPSRARVVFGPPIDLKHEFGEDPDDRSVLPAVTERLMGAIRDLAARARDPDAGG